MATPTEVQKRLDKLTDHEYADFWRKFGGEPVSREDLVTRLVHNPSWERRLCQLLGLQTESEKLPGAAVDRTSAWMAALAVLIALAALLVSLLR